MRPSYWQYEDPDKQTVHYRGKVKIYRGATVENVPCKEVRKNRLKALEDAKLLIKKMKHEDNNNYTDLTDSTNSVVIV